MALLLLVLLLLVLPGCGKDTHVSDAWRMCVEDNSLSCSDCTLSKAEARELAMAHIAQHSKTDDEIYYYSPCSVIRSGSGQGELIVIRYPEGGPDAK